MENKQKFLFTCGGIIAIMVFFSVSLGGCVISKQGQLVQQRNHVKQLFSQIANDYQRRADLVMQNKNVVAVNAAQELAVFKALRDQAAGLRKAIPVNAAGQAVMPSTAQGKTDLMQQFAQFDKLAIDVVNYAADNPEIQSTRLYEDFMTEIEGNENRISVARRDYNKGVEEYANLCDVLPGSIIAGFLGFKSDEFPMFVAAAGTDKAPDTSMPAPKE